MNSVTSSGSGFSRSCQPNSHVPVAPTTTTTPPSMGSSGFCAPVPPGVTCRTAMASGRRSTVAFAAGARLRVWEQILRTLQTEAAHDDEVHGTLALLDGSNFRTHQHAAGGRIAESH